MSSIDDRRDERFDREARRVLADVRLGRLVGVGCGITPTGRRERARALHLIVELAKSSGDVAEIIARASRLAWEQRIAEATSGNDDDPRQAAAKLHDLLDLFDRQGES